MRNSFSHNLYIMWKDPVLLVTVFVLIVVALIQYDTNWGDMCYVKSQVDNQQYKVRNLPDKQQAANLLAQTKQELIRACLLLKKNYPQDPKVDRLLTRFQNTILAEADGRAGQTSYSINKGEQIVLCLRAKNGLPGLVDKNLLLFVALHEISHIMTVSIGHKNEFWENFKFILRNSQKEGVYKCIDFSRNPKEYCGITISSSPLPCQ